MFLQKIYKYIFILFFFFRKNMLRFYLAKIKKTIINYYKIFKIVYYSFLYRKIKKIFQALNNCCRFYKKKI